MLLALLAPGQPAAFPSFPDFIPCSRWAFPRLPAKHTPHCAAVTGGCFGKGGTLVLASPALSLSQELHLILVMSTPAQRGAVFPRGVVYLGEMLGCHPGVLSAHPSPGSQRGLGSLGLSPLPIPSVSLWHRLLCRAGSATASAASGDPKISSFWSCL